MSRVSFNPIHSERAFDGEEAVCMTRGFDGPSPCAMALDMILVDRSDPWEYIVNTGIGTYKFLRTQPNSGLIKTAVQELNSITERLRKGGHPHNPVRKDHGDCRDRIDTAEETG